ncbi:MAG TPA: transcriptional activator RfaH [Alphaproteobacteria bacterium]|nr:transcriptional activator RfaH [Alphaproteobacteria bacterium]
MSAGKRWYAVHTRPHAEARALENLERQGFEAWLPLYRKQRRRARRSEQVLRPLFPRYLFVALDLDGEQWRPVLSTYGVADLVSSGDGPLALADAVIDALRARADEDGHYTLARGLKPGDKVRIESGPMRNLEGILEVEGDTDRVVVMLHLLGREVRVKLSSDEIDRA